MTLNKEQLSAMTTRQKAIAGIVLIAVVVVIWQVIGMMRGGSSPASSSATASKGSGSAPPQSMGPRLAEVPRPQLTAQQQKELIQLQQATQQKYVEALNELQMLKLTQQMAAVNKDIAAAKLATVTAEKGIVDLLTKPETPVETPTSFTHGFNRAPSSGGNLTIQPISEVPPGQTASTPPQEANPGYPAAVAQQPAPANYIVISVSELLNKWAAVIGYQGKLYSVFVGDVLPADQSTVVAIDKYGLVLEKDGVQRRISLVPII